MSRTIPTSVTREMLIDMMVADRASREPGAARPLGFLFTEWSEVPNYAWGYSCPTFDERKLITKRPKLRSAAHAWASLCDRFPMVSIPSVLSGKVVIAGGIVTQSIIDSANYKNADVDFFLVGDCEAKALETIENLMVDFRKRAVGRELMRIRDELCEKAFRGAKTLGFPDEIDNDIRTWCLEAAGRIDANWEEYEKFPQGVLLGEGLFYNKNGRFYPQSPCGEGISLTAWTKFVEEGLACSFAEPKFDVIRNRNAISFTYQGVVYQIILRLYEKPSDITFGFDLGSSAVAFNFIGRKPHLQMSSFGHFAMQTGYNIINTNLLSTTFSTRLMKYFKRGFGFIAPELDRAALVPASGISIYNMRLSTDKVVGMRAAVCIYQDYNTNEPASDYAPGEISHHMAVSRNIKELWVGGNNFTHLMNSSKDQSDTTDLREILIAPVALQDYSIKEFFTKLGERILSDGKFDLKLFKRFLTPIGREANGLPPMPSADLKDLVGLDKMCDIHSYIEKLVDEISDILMNHWNTECAKFIPVSIMTEKPYSQEKNYKFTGSVNPIDMTAAEFYGDNYCPIAALQ